MGFNEYKRPRRGGPLRRAQGNLPKSAGQSAVREGLRSWGRRRHSLESERDPLVLAGLAEDGITKEEIHALTGLGRATIDRIEKGAQ
jgi:hypothetical protein